MTFSPIFFPLEYPHENEIIWSQRGFKRTPPPPSPPPPPPNPSGSATLYIATDSNSLEYHYANMSVQYSADVQTNVDPKANKRINNVKNNELTFTYTSGAGFNLGKQLSSVLICCDDLFRNQCKQEV